MKRIGYLVLMTILFMNCSNSEEGDNDFNPISEDYAKELVCKLTSLELAERKEFLRDEIIENANSIKELSNGYEVAFDHDDEMAKRLLEFVLLENECCSFFNFQLTFKSYKRGMVLKIRGVPGVKMFMKEMWKGRVG